MSKYTVFFVIRCSAADMIPEAFRRCGRNRGDETDSDGRAEAVPATGSRRSARGMLRGVRGRFIHSVELCTRPSYRNSAAGTFFCLSGPACGGCRRKRGRSLSLGCLVFVRSPSPRPPGCPRTRSGPHVCRSVCSRRSGLLPGRDSDTVARRFFCFDNFDLFCTDLAVFWDPARGIQFAIP